MLQRCSVSLLQDPQILLEKPQNPPCPSLLSQLKKEHHQLKYLTAASKLFVALMRQEGIHRQHNNPSSHQAIFTVLWLPVPSCQHLTEDTAPVNYKHCHIKWFITFVFRFVPSAKSSNRIKAWIMKLHSRLKGRFKLLWLHIVCRNLFQSIQMLA